MEIKYTKHFLNKLENVFAESDFNLRYERGQFKSGWCVLNKDKVVVVNKYYTLEGKINTLVDVLQTVEMKKDDFRPKTLEFFNKLRAQKPSID